MGHSLTGLMVLQALLAEFTFPLGIPAAASALGLVLPHTLLSQASSSAQDPVLAPAPTWAFVLDSVATPGLLGHVFVSLALPRLAPPL